MLIRCAMALYFTLDYICYIYIYIYIYIIHLVVVMTGAKKSENLLREIFESKEDKIQRIIKNRLYYNIRSEVIYLRKVTL